MKVRFAYEVPNIGLTQARLKEVLNYNPATGIFTWRGRKGIREGRVAGCSEHGYARIRADRRLYQGHRLAWLYVHGSWPVGQIDHEDRDRADNRISKLRDVTHAQNCQNATESGRNTTGFKGVSVDRSRNRFKAQISYDCGKAKFLGRFADPEDAARAYAEAAVKFHTHNPAAWRWITGSLSHEIERLGHQAFLSPLT